MELDLDALEREFNESWVDPEAETGQAEDTADGEVEESEESETEDIETTEAEEEEETEEEETPEEETEIDQEPFTEKKKQTKEENAAFAEMRRKQEELEQQNKILEQVAAQYGMTVPQFQEAYKQQQEETRAKDQGVPVEVLRRMESMEQQLNQQKGSAAKEKFYSEVDVVKAKYDLTNDDVNKIFNYLGEQGLVNLDTKLPSVGFEFAYKAANFDNVLERKKTEAKQEVLAAKKKRQTNSAKGHNTNSNVGTQVKEDYTVDEVEAMLRKEGLL